MSAATLMGGLSPAQWRALNALFYAGRIGMNAFALRDTQRVEWQQLVNLETGGFVVALLGPKAQVRLADMRGASHVVRVRLADRGSRRVTNNPANQVIAIMGGKGAARVRDLKAEGRADDNLLFGMSAAELIRPVDAEVALSAFKRLPRDLVLRLTPKGRAYWPHDMVGASA